MPVFAGFLFLLVSLAVTMGLLNKRQSISKKAAEQENNLSQSDYTKILPLANKDPLYKFSVDGKVELNSNSSFLRIILVDDEKNEYLVYETDVLLADSNSFSVVDACVETCVLNGITSDFLRVEGNRSTFELSKTNVFTNAEQLSSSLGTADFTAKAQEIKKQKENLKIEKLKEGIKKKGMNWVAGETSVSKLSYAEKKKLFPNPDGSPITSLPNLQGFEYYIGGVFKLLSDNPLSSNSNYSLDEPLSWDWRFAHGENWLTSVKNQGNCGSCWAFAGVAAEEAAINLYYNQHANFDLSEQEAVSCIDTSLGCSGGWPSDVHEFTKESGIVDENCFNYQAQNLPCNGKCGNSSERKFFVNDRESAWNADEKTLKETIIKKGALSISISSWNHAMALVGFNGRSDWKLLDRCYFPLELCAFNQGCISTSCSTLGETMTVCASNFNNPSEVQTGQQITFTCKETKSGRAWVFTKMEYCPGADACFNNECRERSEVTFNEGYTECSYNYFYNKVSYDISDTKVWQYLPQQGENYWIFKNSWGTNWGENGYARMTIPMSDFGEYSFVKAPYAFPANHSYWPASFNNQVNCVDKDNDTYCNWGISEVKPSTCPSFCKVEKDCNDANTALGSFDQNYNCLPAVPTPTPVYPGCSNFRIANPVVQKGFFNPLSWTRGANTGLAAVFIRKKNTDNTWGSWQHLITSLADGWSTYTAPNEIGTYEVGVNVYDADCNDKWLCVREAGVQGWTTKLYSVTACPADGANTVDSTKSVLTNVCTNTCRGTFEVVATLTPTPVPVTLPRITTATLPDGTLNKWYQQNIVATDIGVDETLTMKVIFGLPNALWLGTGQCSQSVVAGKKQISCPVRGYPRQTGTFGIGVSVKDNFGNVGRRTVTLIIR